MAMGSDAVINPAMVRKIDGSVSRIDHPFHTEKLLRDLVHAENLLYFFLSVASDCKDLSFSPNNNIGTLQETDMSLACSICDGLLSRLLL